METWPAELQDTLLVDGFQVRFGDTLVRSDMDVGPAKLRSRYTDGVDEYTCTINLEYDDWAVLNTFYKTTLSNGALTFGYDDPMTGVASEFRFKEPPVVVPLGGRFFRVSMTWEKML